MKYLKYIILAVVGYLIYTKWSMIKPMLDNVMKPKSTSEDEVVDPTPGTVDFPNDENLIA
jgi:hypothetical protein